MPTDAVAKVNRKGIRLYNPQYEKKSDRLWNLIGLPIIASLLMTLSIALIIVGATKNIDDLILVGCIFLFGAFIFYVLMYCTVCRPACHRNVIETYEFTDTAPTLEPLKGRRPDTPQSMTYNIKDTAQTVRPLKSHRPETPASSDMTYYNASFDMNEDLIDQAKRRPTPSEDQLYGHISRAFLATPATVSGVKILEDDAVGSATPPPPRLALPREPGDSQEDSVFTMDVNKVMATQAKEMSQLELL